MTKTMLAALVAAIAMAGGLAAGCTEKSPSPGPAKPGATAADATKAAAVAEIAQKTCPVMGGKIDPKLFVDYEGRRIYFCCAGCPEVFLKDPAKYLAKVDAELKAAAAAKSGA